MEVTGCVVDAFDGDAVLDAPLDVVLDVVLDAVSFVVALLVADTVALVPAFPTTIPPASDANDARLSALTATRVFSPCRRRAHLRAAGRSAGGLAAMARRSWSRRMRSARASGVVSLIGLLRSLPAVGATVRSIRCVQGECVQGEGAGKEGRERNVRSGQEPAVPGRGPEVPGSGPRRRQEWSVVPTGTTQARRQAGLASPGGRAMASEHASRRHRTVEPHTIAPDVGGFVDDEGIDEDAVRHYHGDPNHLAEFGPDPDEISETERLEIDQVELEELGLVLDDPHQPRPD